MCRLHVVLTSALILLLVGCQSSPSSDTASTSQQPNNPNEQANQIANQAIAAMGQMQTLSGPAADGTHDCAGGGVTIQASGVQTTLTGDCATLTIEGSDNRISAERVTSVAIRGDGNTVTHAPGITPMISQVGENNSIRPR